MIPVNLSGSQTPSPGSQTGVWEPGESGDLSSSQTGVWELDKSSKHWRSDLLALLLFLLLPVLSFPELFFQPRTLYRGDLTWIHFPLRLMAAEQWRSGEIPLWNPYVLAGTPLLAEAQVGILQPLNALFLLPLPPYRILTLFVMLHFTLGAFFTYLLARVLGIGRAGAVLGGLSFGFGGFLMAQVTNLNIMTGAAWLPLVFCGFVWALRTQRVAAALLAGVPLALHIFAAQPQVPFFTLLFLLGYAFYETIRIGLTAPAGARLAGIGKIWGLLGLMLVSGLLLAAPQILPTWEMQRLSVRSGGVNYEQLTYFSLPPVQWVALAIPNVFGTTVTGYHGVAGNFEEMNIYIGLLPLLMVFFSWQARSQRPQVLFFWLAAGVAGLLALGGYTPIFDLVQYLPGFTLFRAPTRWLLIVNLALALLAAYGFEAVLARPPGRRGRLILTGLWASLAILLFCLWWWKEPVYQWVDTLPNQTELVQAARELTGRGLFELPSEYEDKIILGHLGGLVIPGVALLTRLGLAIALVIAYSLQRLSRRTFVGLAIALVAFDLAITGGTAVNRTTGADHWEKLSGGVHYLLETMAKSTDRFYTVANSRESEVVAGLKHYFPGLYQLPASGGHSPFRLERYSIFMEQAHPLVRMALTATRYILNKGRLTADAESVMPIRYQDEEWYVYEYPLTLPRAFVMRRAAVVADGEAALSYLREGEFDPRSLLILETDQPLPEVSPEVAGPDEVTITRQTPSLVEIQAKLPGDGFLVLLDTDYPGWKAYVDGQPRPIMRAYYRTRAIFLEAGEHTVLFVYRPLSFYGGVALAVVGLALVVGAVIWEKRN